MSIDSSLEKEVRDVRFSRIEMASFLRNSPFHFRLQHFVDESSLLRKTLNNSPGYSTRHDEIRLRFGVKHLSRLFQFLFEIEHQFGGSAVELEGSRTRCRISRTISGSMVIGRSRN